MLFLYREVLAIELPWLDEVIAAKTAKRFPVVFTHVEMRKLLDAMSGTTGLIARLLYGTGMRLQEGVLLRVKDVEFSRREIIVREGKRNKDSALTLASMLIFRAHIHR